MAANNESVLVTGGNGFIASHILAQLLEVCFPATVLDSHINAHIV